MLFDLVFDHYHKNLALVSGILVLLLLVFFVARFIVVFVFLSQNSFLSSC